ncbi:MAG TPA: PVC-type heme-binding CxxCH protein, partial [Pirellulales bacterium]
MPVHLTLRGCGCLLLLASLGGLLFADETPKAPADKSSPKVDAETKPAAKLNILMLGDEGHHRPLVMHRVVGGELRKSEIELTYTADVRDLNPDNLKLYDGLLIYRDSGDLPAENEQALLEFIEKGKGLVAVHCASHCFRNSAKYTALVGGRFDRHESGVFRARIIDAQHPAMKDARSFESWDETYLHNEVSEDRRVLMVREHAGGYEPYTWVRRQGEGRVYYTALGHDERTWREPGYIRLLAAGLRWAAGRVPDAIPTPDFTDAGEGLPNYVAGQKWGTEADRLRRMPLPLSPADSLARLHMPEGFRAELFAAEPDVVKPIAMAFDARGRLWVAESLDYPNTLREDPHENGTDRIKICEDTDGDGRADRFTVFAENLNIPTSLLPVPGGVIVAVSPHILLIEDKDGDGRGESRRVLFSGFGRADTHAVTSNLHYGFDNWIYATVGYSGGKVKSGDTEHSFRQGLFRFRPDGSDFEVLTSTSNNTWGLGIDEAGDVFASTANNEHSVQLAIPNRYFERVHGFHAAGSAGIEDHKRYHPIADDVRQMDWHGGFTSAAGHELYTARAFPSEYWNRAALVCEPTGHLVHLDWLVPRGSGYVARDGYNLVASTDPWSAPIGAAVGPDGGVWVLDWYNYVVQHNPTPHGFKTGKGNAYETTLRDKSHGRVYRITHDAARGTPAPRLDIEKPAELLAAFSHDNLLWRLQAQQLLVARGKNDVQTDLAAIIEKSDNPAAVIHALWTLVGLRKAPGGEAFEPRLAELCSELLKHTDASVRRNALRALPSMSLGGAQSLLAAPLLKDPNPQQRLDVLLTLADSPGGVLVGKQLAALLEEPGVAEDRWLPLAVTCAAARSGADFLNVVAKREDAQPPPAALLNCVRIVAGDYAHERGARPIAPLLKSLAAGDLAVAEAAVAGLAAGWPENRPPKVDEELQAALVSLLEKLRGGSGLQVIALANRWNAGEALRPAAREMRAGLLREAVDGERAEKDRVASVEGLLQLDSSADAVAVVVELISPKASPELVAGLLDALGRAKSGEVAGAILGGWSRYTPAAQSQALAVLLRRPEWTAALLDALEQDRVPAGALSVEMETRLSQHPDAKLRERAKALLARGGRLTNPDRQAILDELLPLADRRGDASAGKLVFEKNCGKCHRHGGQGGAVGPDLTGVAARKRRDILTEVLDPNRSVEGNYQQYTVATSDGRVLTGLLAAETKTTIELLDVEAKRQVILREEIDELAGSKRSLMPEGFEKLPAEELVNLLEFLSARGRFLPLPLERVATSISTKGMFINPKADVERLIFPSWEPQTFFGVPFHLIDP